MRQMAFWFLIIGIWSLYLAGYVSVSHWQMWRWMLRRSYPDSRIGLFRNLPHIKPGRWGFYVFGLEVGSRNPQDKVGVWLKERGL